MLQSMCPSAQCVAGVGMDSTAMTTRLVPADSGGEAEHEDKEWHEKEASAVGEQAGEEPDGGRGRNHDSGATPGDPGDGSFGEWH
jgi:hypothetical protein